MRLLITLSRIPYPLEKGDKLRAYHQIKSLISQNIHVTIVCFHFEKPNEDNIKHLVGLGGNWHFIQLEKWRVPFQLIKIIWSDLPLQVILFYNHSAHKLFKKILQSSKPTHIFSQLIRTSEYVKEESLIEKTLDYMDALSAGLKRRAAHAKWYEKWLFNWEYDRVRKYEQGVYHYFDHHTIISENDAAQIEIGHPIDVISNGIDERFTNAQLPKHLNCSVIFTGNMSYPPNVSAALRLGLEIMPLVWKSIPKAKLIVAGAEPHRSLIHHLSDHRISITGWVEDMIQEYEKGDVFVAPMTLGSGMQNKIIEALSLGKPVICTELVAQAFQPEVQSLLCVKATNEEFAKSIIEHLQGLVEFDQAFSREIIKKHFSWSETTEKLLALLRS